jgi:hypothetical protein
MSAIMAPEGLYHDVDPAQARITQAVADFNSAVYEVVIIEGLSGILTLRDDGSEVFDSVPGPGGLPIQASEPIGKVQVRFGVPDSARPSVRALVEQVEHARQHLNRLITKAETAPEGGFYVSLEATRNPARALSIRMFFPRHCV